jgi:hypothetical protein
MKTVEQLLEEYMDALDIAEGLMITFKSSPEYVKALENKELAATTYCKAIDAVEFEEE